MSQIVKRTFHTLAKHRQINIIQLFAALCILYVANKSRKLISKYGIKGLFQFITIIMLKKIPGGKQLIDAETEKKKKELMEMVHSQFPPSKHSFYTLPDHGVERAVIHEELLYQLSHEKQVRKRRAHGGIYTSLKKKYDKYLENENNIIECINEHLSIEEEAYLYFSHTNTIFPLFFPGIRKFERELVHMVSDMLHAKEAAGTITSGGTESIMLAMRSWREYGKKVNGIYKPNIIVPITGHPTFNKAGGLLGIEVRMIDIKTSDNSYTVDLKKVEDAVDSNTICIIGSAPCFGYNVIDDIEGLCDIAKRHGNIPVHVDNCLGGFLISFLDTKKPFDFRVDGVCSMSCDIHKQAGSPKGCSAVIYKAYKYREYQYYVYTTWPGGLYVSSGLRGSSNGGPLAVAWSMLLYKGKDQLKADAIKAHKAIGYLKQRICDEIEDCDILGDPIGCGLAFKFKNRLYDADYAIIEQLHDIGGWDLHRMQFPNAVSFRGGLNWVDELDQLMVDLKKAVAIVKPDPKKYINTGMASVYGQATQCPDRSLIVQQLYAYMDAIHTVHTKDEE